MSNLMSCCNNIHSVNVVETWNPTLLVLVTTVFALDGNDQVITWDWTNGAWKPYKA